MKYLNSKELDHYWMQYQLTAAPRGVSINNYGKINRIPTWKKKMPPSRKMPRTRKNLRRNYASIRSVMPWQGKNATVPENKPNLRKKEERMITKTAGEPLLSMAVNRKPRTTTAHRLQCSLEPKYL